MDANRSSTLTHVSRWFFESLSVLGFLLVIAAPTLDKWVRPDDSVRSPEKPELRMPAACPAPPRTMRAFADYPAAYEAYFKDSFGLRDKLLRWNSIVKFLGFGVSPSAEVYVGREGWLFYDGEHSKQNHRGAYAFSPQELEQWSAVLERKRARLEALGVQYLYVVAPDKESVYPELLPDYMKPIGPTRLDQWLECLKLHAPKVEILDLRAALEAAKVADKPDEWVYTSLGTHWSGRGAQAALRAMLERMNGLVGGFVPEEIEAFRRVDSSGNGDSWATRMYISDLLPTPTHGFVPRETHAKNRFEGNFRFGRLRKSEIEGSSRPRLILMHDSFGPHIEQGLAEQCSYLECRWDTFIAVSDIEEAGPAILVDMYVERSLNCVDPKPLIPTDGNPWQARFEASTNVLLAVDRSAPNWGLAGLGSTVFGPAALTPRPRLPVRLIDPRDMLGLGILAPIPGEIPVLHLWIESPANTELALSYKPEGQSEFARPYRHPLQPGSNEIFEALEQPGTSGELVLRPGLVSGTYLLRDFEIRSVPRP